MSERKVPKDLWVKDIDEILGVARKAMLRGWGRCKSKTLSDEDILRHERLVNTVTYLSSQSNHRSNNE